MKQYKPQEFEKKWQDRWDAENLYRTPNPGEESFDPKKPSYYVLDMFPYPSGSGLHVGHASGYIGTDIIARRKRMEGFNVLHPMGWDAFGLPAEQYAIQTGQHPRVTTERNADNFRRQLKLLGLSYDWNREIDTSVPEYYRWTQWLYLKLYKKGLVYQKEVAVWWCEDLKTVLANEEVINGRSERGNHPCVRRPLKQWVLKITEYADRLIEDIDLLEWPEHVKKMQSDWIGRSEGAEIDFRISGGDKYIRVFSTRPDTLFGVTALVLAPEHPWVRKLTTADRKTSTESYVTAVASKSELERKAETKEITGMFLGSYVEHPLLPTRKVPIYISEYVIADYGTGAVMSVPAHDERDYRFAKAMGLSQIEVIKPENLMNTADCYTGEGTLVNSGDFTGLSSAEARMRIVTELEARCLGQKKVTYKLKDWVFSRQRYWGEPFPLSFAPDDSIVPVDESELPILLPEMTNFTPSDDGSAPLNRVPEWVNHTLRSRPGIPLKRSTDTMPGWAGSCWYYLRFMDPHNSGAPFSKDAVNYWKQVDMYIGGTAHAVMHLLYARFWHKVFFDLKLVPTPEPFKRLFNQGMVTAFAFRDSTGRLVPTDEVEQVGEEWRRIGTEVKLERFVTKMAKSLKNVVNPDDVIANHGCDVLRIYEMFMGPLADDKPWTDDGISGCERFLKRVWSLFHDDEGKVKAQFLAASPRSLKDDSGQLAIEQALHRALKRVNDSFDNLNFNTSVAAMMEFLNAAYEQPASMTRIQAEMFLRILSPFCPHITAELWAKTAHEGYIDYQPWPAVISEFLQDDNFELVITVNGKPRRRLQVRRGTAACELEDLALNVVQDLVAGQTIIKVIVVPDKLVNIVAKG
ncbi:MAG: leucine--tRNA ligase [Bdellovibrionales bacterium]|nr:leucine--tRNA ligase [Bdellovibrionales bacterium]